MRKSIGDIRHTLPAGIVGPGFNDDFGDTFGIIYGFTADGFTHRELRDYVEERPLRTAARPRCLEDRDSGRAGREGSSSNSPMKELANLGIDRSALIAALQAQNVVQPAGTIQTGYETLALRVSGAFQSEAGCREHQFRRRRPDAAPERHRAGPARLLPIRRSRCFASTASRPSALRSPCATAATFSRSARTSSAAMTTITADLPLGIEPTLVADQAVTVDSAISEFMTSLWQAVAIILVVSFISLGVRPGLVIALAIPLTLAIVFSIMELAGIDMQRISLGALIIALALLVDDAMTTTDAMLTRLAQGDDKVQAATFAFRTYAFAMLAGTLVTIAGFVPGRLRRELGRRIHVLAVCRGRASR